MASKRPVQPAHASNGEASSSSSSYSSSGVASWLAKTQSTEVKSVLDQAATDFATFWAKYPAEETERKGNAPAGTQVAKDPSKWPQSTHASLLRNEADLLKDIVKYGQMVQTVYDTLQTKDTESQFFGLCWKDVMEEGVELGEYADKGIIVLPGSKARKYTVVTRIEADSGAYNLVCKGRREYLGYVAEGPEDESGGIDVAVVFRGTVTKSEWFQDAKSLQVAWNKGRPAAYRTSKSLKFWPLGLDTLAVLLTWLGLRVLCALSPALANFLTGAASLPPFAWATGLISSAFACLVGLEGGDLGVTSACLLVGLVVGVVKGMWDAGGQYPTRKEWLKELAYFFFISFLDWTRWGVVNVFKAFFDVSQDPHVSFGFKEMYAEAQYADQTDGPASPRYTILAALTRLLNKYEKYNKEKPHSKPRRHIKSITVTGHSLGGALASLCAWDLADTLSERSDTLPSFLLSGSFAWALGLPTAPDNLFQRTERQREAFIRAVRDAQTSTDDKPIVAAVTWAAPRVGDQMYTSYFTGCSLVDPSRLPVKTWWFRWLQAALYAGRKLQLHLGPAFTVVQVGVNGLVLAGLWWLYQSVAGTNPVAAAITAVAGVTVLNVAVSLLRNNTDPKPVLRPAMLRVVDAADLVPEVPLAFPVSRLGAYAHGGYELRVNYDLVPYFSPVAGLTEVSRYHNLEMYMHLVDPRRSMALANRTERVLDKALKVPGSWWSPVPNNSMVSRDGGKTWVKHEGLPVTEWCSFSAVRRGWCRDSGSSR